MSRAVVVGLTGGIGSGKSAASDAFAALGVPVIDADVVAREVVAPGTPALAEIEAYFGAAVISSDGSLNRAALRQLVFNDTDKKQWLNKLLHPAIRQQMQAKIAQVHYAYCILAVPLLVENNLIGMTDRVVVVDCPPQMQIDRASARDNSDADTIKKIMAAQADRQTRLAAADDVIDNSGSLAQLQQQVATLHAQYLRMQPAP